jgi:hypothetical protein
LVVDATTKASPTEVGAIASADTALTGFSGLEMTNDEQVLFVSGQNGFEAYDISDPTAPSRTFSNTGARNWRSIAYNPDDGWVAVFARANNTNIAFETYDIDVNGLPTLNTAGNIATTDFTTTVASAGTRACVANTDAATALFRGTATGGVVVVFDMSDLTAPLIHEKLTPGDLSSWTLHCKSIQPTNRDNNAQNKIWIQQDLDAKVEVFRPALTNNKIPCELQIGRIKVTLETLPCATVAWLTGIPAGGPTITNLDADLLDGEEGSFYSPATHNHNLGSLTDVTITSPVDQSFLIYDTATALWIDGLADSVNFTGTEWIDLTDAGATTLHKHDHGGMDGLTDDDHTQYALLAGRSGGQTLIGGTGSGDDLTLSSTSNATKGNIFFLDVTDFGNKRTSNASFIGDHLRGMLLENHTDTNHDILVNTGGFAVGGEWIIHNGPMIKQIDAAWAEGTNQGGMATGSVAADTHYHFFAIYETADKDNVDFMFDTDSTGINVPASWSVGRRIGSIFTNGAANIRNFEQLGNWFFFDTPVTDVNDTTITNNTWETGTFSVPPGCVGMFRAFSDADGAAFHIVAMRPGWSSWSVNIAAGYGYTIGSTQTPNILRPQIICPVDNARQADYIQNITGAGTNVEVEIHTLGYYDPRGREGGVTL